MFNCRGYIFLSLTAVLAIIATVKSRKVSSITEAQKYLSKYGYLSPHHNTASSNLLNEETFIKGMDLFQSFAGLNATGKLDEETLQLMSMPRCGVQDMKAFTNVSRSKRYALQGSRWPNNNLKYKIVNYPSRSTMSMDEVDAEIARAFSVWSNWSALTFTRQQIGAVHITILFAVGAHGDADPFDGPGNTLAHAFFPESGGSVHFNSHEIWTIESYHGTNLFQTAVHEIGHALGLSHSDERDAIMEPFYRGYQSNFKLDPDDIAGIQALYGKKSTAPNNALCKDPTIDVIFNLADDEICVFKGDLYYVIRGNSLAEGYPKNISENWKDLPRNINGAFTHPSGKTFFFKADQFWIYNGGQMDSLSPRDTLNFFGLTGYFDTVMFRRETNTIYFFDGSSFWTYDFGTHQLTRNNIRMTGLPNYLDAAFEDDNGYAFFFKDKEYYRFDDNTDSVDFTATPSYPRPIDKYWFGC